MRVYPHNAQHFLFRPAHIGVCLVILASGTLRGVEAFESGPLRAVHFTQQVAGGVRQLGFRTVHGLGEGICCPLT